MGRSCHLINLKQTGYNRALSTFYEATLRGDIIRTGNNYLIDGYDKKITPRKFLEMAEEDFKMVEKMYFQLEKKLEPLLSSSDKEQKKEVKPLSEGEEEDIISAALFNLDDGDDE
jgi:protein subunit release factor A